MLPLSTMPQFGLLLATFAAGPTSVGNARCGLAGFPKETRTRGLSGADELPLAGSKTSRALATTICKDAVAAIKLPIGCSPRSILTELAAAGDADFLDSSRSQSGMLKGSMASVAWLVSAILLNAGSAVQIANSERSRTLYLLSLCTVASIEIQPRLV